MTLNRRGKGGTPPAPTIKNIPHQQNTINISLYFSRHKNQLYNFLAFFLFSLSKMGDNLIGDKQPALSSPLSREVVDLGKVFPLLSSQN